MATSLNPYISKFDEGFDVGQSSNYKMTIQFALGGLSFALLDNPQNRIIGLECHQVDTENCDDVFQILERTLDSKELNNKTLYSVTCIIDERTNLFIPEALSNPESDKQYLDFTFRIYEDYIRQSERIESINASNAYAYPKRLHDRIIEKWPAAKITHSSTVFLNSCFEYAPEGRVVFVNVRKRDFDVVIVNDGKLQFFNNFKFNTKADFAYFLFFALEQNQVKTLEVPVCFSGLILPNSGIIELCSRYIKYVLFCEDRHVLQVSKALEDVPYQYYHIHYQALR